MTKNVRLLPFSQSQMEMVSGGTLFFEQDEKKNIFITGPSAIIFSVEMKV